jgi:hypothetical protein
MVPAAARAWHHLVVYFVLLAAAIAILVGVVVVAMGRGGEIVRFHRDLPLVPPRISTAADIRTLHLPLALFGYQDEAADAALAGAARLLAEQDAEIARLRAQLRRLTVAPNGDAGPDTADSEGQDTPDAVSGQPQPQP